MVIKVITKILGDRQSHLLFYLAVEILVRSRICLATVYSALLFRLAPVTCLVNSSLGEVQALLRKYRVQISLL